MADWEIIKKLIQIVKEEEISGLAIEENGVKYEVRREAGGVVGVAPLPLPHSSSSSPVPATEEAIDECFDNYLEYIKSERESQKKKADEKIKEIFREHIMAGNPVEKYALVVGCETMY